MARPKDASKITMIKEYLKKKGVATTYTLGKVIGANPNLAKSYLDDLIRDNIVFKQEVIENGRVKIYYSLDKKLLPKKKDQTTLDTESISNNSISKLITNENDVFGFIDKLMNYLRRMEASFTYINALRDDEKQKKNAEIAWKLIVEGMADAYEMKSADENEMTKKMEKEFTEYQDALEILTIALKEIIGER